MKKSLSAIFFCLLVSNFARAQSNQEKAQELSGDYLTKTSNFKSNLKFNAIQVLRGSFSDTKKYKILVYKIDSLKKEGRRIDARIARLKTAAELNQSKKDSKHLSNELVATSDQLIDFMTQYKGPQTGWTIKPVSRNKSSSKKTFYLNLALTKVDSVR